MYRVEVDLTPEIVSEGENTEITPRVLKIEGLRTYDDCVSVVVALVMKKEARGIRIVEEQSQ